jgi:O-antigen ligase
MTQPLGRRFFFPDEDVPVRFALLMLGALLTLPFLVPYHYDPIGSFHAEWLAALCGLLACVGLLSPTLWRESTVPLLLLLPLGLLALVLLQLALDIVVFPQQTLLFALYLIWATLLIVLGAALRHRVGMAPLCDWLAACLLAGALAGCIAAMLSHDPVMADQPLIFGNLGQASFHGNLAQPNHLANQLWLGIGAALYLLLRHCLGTAIGVIGITLLMAIAVLTGSRTTLAYLGAFVAMAVFARWRWPGDIVQRALRLTLLLVPLYVVCDLGAALASSLGWNTLSTPMAKLGSQGFEVIRLQLIEIGWRGFLSAPLLGHGVGSFPQLSMTLSSQVHFSPGPGAAEHAHNLLAQFLAELGGPATLGLVAMLAYWLWRGLRQARQEGGSDALAFAWITAALAVEAVHSMLEYPLWYAFFLGPTALLLGIGDTRRLHLSLAPRARLVVAMLLLAGGATLFSLRFDYVLLEDAVNPWLVGKKRVGAWEDLLALAGPMQRQSMLYPYLCTTAVTRLRMPPEPIDAALQISECAMRVMPIDRVVFRRALVLAYAGHADEASVTWQQALSTYPRGAVQAAAELKAMQAGEAGSPLQPLLALAEAAAKSSPAPQAKSAVDRKTAPKP